MFTKLVRCYEYLVGIVGTDGLVLFQMDNRLPDCVEHSVQDGIVKFAAHFRLGELKSNYGHVLHVQTNVGPSRHGAHHKTAL